MSVVNVVLNFVWLFLVVKDPSIKMQWREVIL